MGACGQGKSKRKAYSYTRSNGTTVHVKSSCITKRSSNKRASKAKTLKTNPRKSSSRNKGRKSNKISNTPQRTILNITLRKGLLGKYGYSTKVSAVKRRKALLSAVKDESYASIVRHLNVIRIYNKNREALFKIFDSDIKWMQKNLKPKYSKAALDKLKKKQS